MTINQIDLIGLTAQINKAPITNVINAPTNGINAVIHSITEIINANGILNIVINTKHNIPINIASVHCPDKKFENAALVNLNILIIFLTILSGKNA